MLHFNSLQQAYMHQVIGIDRVTPVF